MSTIRMIIRYFNTSPSTRGFWTRGDIVATLSDFNTSPSTRGFRTGSTTSRRRPDFNTSPSTRGFGFLSPLERHIFISIPAPPRGASSASIRQPQFAPFQYQPLHEGLRPTDRAAIRFTRFQYQPLHEGLRRTAPSRW